jgi:GDP-L-fucose synthase
VNVVVTGASGFLGGHLMQRLPQAYGVERTYDLRDSGHVWSLFKQAGNIDVLVHLAGLVGGIDSNRTRPGQFFYDNMLMGMNVVHAAMQFEVKKLVMVGTTCSYPKFTRCPFNEYDLFDGLPEETNAPYGIAKRALYIMLEAYRQEYGLEFSYLIPANLYGPGDRSDHVIPMLIKKCLSDDDLIVWGSGEASRDFAYVEDVADALVLAVEGDAHPKPINLGSGREIKISELVELIRTLIGHTGAVKYNRGKPNGQPRRCLDTRRAEHILGWKAITPLEQGLKSTVEWWREIL